MITKFCIVILAVVSCTMVGLKLSKNSAARAKYFLSLTNFISFFTSEIKFRQKNLTTVLQEFSQKNDTALNANIAEFIEYLRDDKKEFSPSRGALKQVELLDVKEFFLSLGAVDAETQLFELERYMSKFESYYSDAAAYNKKYGGLYIKLGFLLGLAIGILFI